MKIKPFPFCIKAFCVMITILFVVETMAAQYEIEFVGRRSSTEALLKIDGKDYRLQPGAKTPHGIKLVSVTREEAVIMIDDTKYRYAKGSSKGTPLVLILIAKGGHFRTKGTINNKPVNFLIDTGATGVVLSKEEARRLKIPYKKRNRIELETASKPLTGYLTKLDSVGVGDILLKDIDALVAKDFPGKEILLGMSFLKRLRINYDGATMILKQ